MIYNSAPFLQGVQQVDCRYWLEFFKHTVCRDNHWNLHLQTSGTLISRYFLNVTWKDDGLPSLAAKAQRQ